MKKCVDRFGNDENDDRPLYTGAYSAGRICCEDGYVFVADMAVEGKGTVNPISVFVPFVSTTGAVAAYAISVDAVVALVVGAVENQLRDRALGTDDEDDIFLAAAGGGCNVSV